MRRRPLFALALVVYALFLAACGSDETATQTPQDGEALFVANCSGCHGSQASGTMNGPSLLSQVYEPGHHPDAAFRQAIASGSPQHHWQFGDMPAIAGMDEDEVDAVVSYVRGLQEELGLVPYG